MKKTNIFQKIISMIIMFFTIILISSTVYGVRVGSHRDWFGYWTDSTWDLDSLS